MRHRLMQTRQQRQKVRLRQSDNASESAADWAQHRLGEGEVADVVTQRRGEEKHKLFGVDNARCFAARFRAAGDRQPSLLRTCSQRKFVEREEGEEVVEHVAIELRPLSLRSVGGGTSRRDVFVHRVCAAVQQAVPLEWVRTQRLLLPENTTVRVCHQLYRAACGVRRHARSSGRRLSRSSGGVARCSLRLFL